MAEKQFLNVQYGQIPVRINVTYMVDLSEVQKEVLVAFEEITVGYSKIQLWVTTVENGETKITTWTNLMDLPSTYFAEGGSAVVIKLLAQVNEMQVDIAAFQNPQALLKPAALVRHWSGQDLDPENVKNSISAALDRYRDLFDNELCFCFDKFRDTTLTANPKDPNRPSLLLTNLGSDAVELVRQGANDPSVPSNEMVESCDVVQLLATSGMGKSRSMLEFLWKRFGLYIVPRFPLGKSHLQFGPEDFVRVGDKMNEYNELEWEKNLHTVTRYVRCLVLGRLLILERLFQVRPKLSPSEWLTFQLKSNQTGMVFMELNSLTKDYRLDDLESELSRMRLCLPSLLNRNLKDIKANRLPLLFDESQTLLQMGVGKFKSPKSKEERPLFTAVVSAALRLFEDFRVKPDSFNTLVWTSGTGLSIKKASELMMSNIGGCADYPTQLRRYTINSVLGSPIEVHNYLSQFLPANSVKMLEDELLDDVFELFQGRRRFASTLIEMILASDNVLTTYSNTKAAILLELREQWEKVTRLGTFEEVEFYLSFSKKLLTSAVFSGRPVILKSSPRVQELSVRLFENGVGVLDKFVDDDTWVSLKEPLVVIAGWEKFAMDTKILYSDPNLLFASLGSHFESIVARAIVNHSKQNKGCIDFGTLFGIDRKLLCGTPLENPIPLHNYSKTKTWERRSIVELLNGKADSPIVFPDTRAGPDLVFMAGVDVFVNVQMKFREDFTLDAAFRSVTPEYLYKDKKFETPTGLKERAQLIVEMLKEKKVIRVVIAYPFKAKHHWKNHIMKPGDFRRAKRRQNGTYRNDDYISILVDEQNAVNFFGAPQVEQFDQVRREAEIYSIEYPAQPEDPEEAESEASPSNGDFEMLP